MDTNEILTVRFEPCGAHLGDVDDACDACGWLAADHHAERGAEPVVEDDELPLAA